MKTKTIENIIKYKITIITTIVAIIIYGITIIFDYDIFENLIAILQKVEKFELDEILLLSSIILLGFVIDVYRLRIKYIKRLSARQQRIRALKRTMTTVHDIVNNSLNDIKVFDLNSINLNSENSSAQKKKNNKKGTKPKSNSK